MNSLHDVGGMDGFGPVEWEEHEPVFHEPWEAHMRAIDALMTKKLRAYCVDETRHRIERMNPVYYLLKSDRYERSHVNNIFITQ
jgi:nitrile hydratase subunit beta